MAAAKRATRAAVTARATARRGARSGERGELAREARASIARVAAALRAERLPIETEPPTVLRPQIAAPRPPR